MSGIYAALVIVIPILELVVFALVADLIGVIPTLLLLIAVSVVGAVLLVQQGVGAWRRLRETIRRREMPTDELADAALITLAGFLLLTPGFFTDALAFLVVIPASRKFLRGLLRKFAGAFAATRLGWKGKAAVAGKKVYDVQATTRVTPGSGPPEPPQQLPSPGRPSGEDGSPGTG